MAKGKRVNVEETANLWKAAPMRRQARVGSDFRVQHKRPKLGQHFLADHHAAGRIVDALGDVSDKTVIEIGPGRGVLTTILAERARRLIAIELDRVLAAQLRMSLVHFENVEIIEGDILSIDFSTVLGPRPGMNRPGIVHVPEKTRLVGNLPYFITSDILLHLFQYHAYFETIIIMVQEEVADRIAARPGVREYGLLSATVQLYARVEKLFSLPPGAFNPPPKVHSAVLRLTINPQMDRLRVPEEEFIAFLKLSFGQKRKTLANNLKSRFDSRLLAAALKKAGLQPGVRAEAVSLEKMAAVFRSLTAAAAD
ncbi:MAG TPA: 16S rRNA (adenine(1518)-N(6)/adenine(1519)-N(6))-dimethyltransferase RsmA [Terriglobales bacterium]|nr:16S rRNA (adenine(1518)-N(6)/adenine(1519)-N(6))-dimethyltransferase RsmA [Terriglobales bacterium]